MPLSSWLGICWIRSIVSVFVTAYVFDAAFRAIVYALMRPSISADVEPSVGTEPHHRGVGRARPLQRALGERDRNRERDRARGRRRGAEPDGVLRRDAERVGRGTREAGDDLGRCGRLERDRRLRGRADVRRDDVGADRGAVARRGGPRQRGLSTPGHRGWRGRRVGHAELHRRCRGRAAARASSRSSPRHRTCTSCRWRAR